MRTPKYAGIIRDRTGVISITRAECGNSRARVSSVAGRKNDRGREGTGSIVKSSGQLRAAVTTFPHVYGPP